MDKPKLERDCWKLYKEAKKEQDEKVEKLKKELFKCAFDMKWITGQIIIQDRIDKIFKNQGEEK